MAGMARSEAGPGMAARPPRQASRQTARGRIIAAEVAHDQVERIETLKQFLRVNRSAVVRLGLDALWAIHGERAEAEVRRRGTTDLH